MNTCSPVLGILFATAFVSGCSTPTPGNSDLRESMPTTSSMPAGLAVSNPQSTRSDASSTHQWKLPNYTVQFKAGPVKYDAESNAIPHSTYEVVYQGSSGAKLSAVVKSAQDIETLTTDSGFSISDLTHLFLSLSGQSLLIQEKIPNDGGPCTNYILFQQEEKNLVFFYLRLPSQTPKEPLKSKTGMPIHAPIYQWLPTITSITNEIVHFRYPDGEQGHLEISKIPKSQQPSFP